MPEPKKNWWELDVIPIRGRRKAFHVESRSKDEPHLCQLLEIGGFGSCECEHFIYRIEDKAQKGQIARTFENRCEHLKAAFWFDAQEGIDRARSEQ
jgi:hypothetical protein